MAITFSYAPPPLQELYGGKEGFPPSLPSRQSQPGSTCLPRRDWPRFDSRPAPIGGPRRPSPPFPPSQTGVCRDVTGNEEVNNFDRVRFKATLFCL